MAPIFTGSKFGFGISPMLAAVATEYVDPDAANLYFALSYDNTNQVNDVQNIIRAASGVANGTLKTFTKGSAASISSTQKKFYTHSLYSGNDYANGNVSTSISNTPVFASFTLPCTVQFWLYYNSGPKNGGPYDGLMGNFYEPPSGRSGWMMRPSPTTFNWAGFYDGSSTANVISNITWSTGQWYHIALALTGGGTASRLYINGSLQTLTTDGVSGMSSGFSFLTSNITTTFVSGRGNNYAYDSRQDYSDAYFQDVKFYTVARSGTNIINEYNAGLPIITA